MAKLTGIFSLAIGIGLYASTCTAGMIAPDHGSDVNPDLQTIINETVISSSEIKTDMLPEPLDLTGIVEEENRIGVSYAKNTEPELDHYLKESFDEQRQTELFGKLLAPGEALTLRSAIEGPRYQQPEPTWLQQKADDAAYGLKRMEEGKRYGFVLETGARIVDFLLN